MILFVHTHVCCEVSVSRTRRIYKVGLFLFFIWEGKVLFHSSPAAKRADFPRHGKRRKSSSGVEFADTQSYPNISGILQVRIGDFLHATCKLNLPAG